MGGETNWHKHVVPVIRELRQEELSPAVAIIARAMRDNPLSLAAFGSEPVPRLSRLHGMFATVLPFLLERGTLLGAFDAGHCIGIAAMVPSRHCQPNTVEKIALLPRLIPAIGFRGSRRLGRWLGAWSKHDLQEVHSHLGPVAVGVHIQRCGIGSALMNECCRRLDRIKCTGYLETDSLENSAFYERFGFTPVGQVLVLGTPNWLMRRSCSQ